MIAVALANYALSRGDEVTVIVNPASKRLDKVPCGANVLKCDLADYKALSCDLNADIFFHLAWEKTTSGGRDDVYSQLKNVEYSLDALNLAKRLGCKCFVGTGSQAEYGKVSKDLSGNTPTNPESGYGIAKYTAGKMCALLAKNLGLRFCWTRILSIYGENDNPNSLISYVIDTLLKGEKPSLTKCEQVWDYMYADDCARALYLVGEKGLDGKTYVLGSGEKRKLCDYVRAVRDAINPNLPLGFGEKEYYPHQPMYLCADTTDLQKDLGFVLGVTFEQGIEKTINSKKV